MGKIYHIMNKHRSPDQIIIEADDWMNEFEDKDWFLEVKFIKKKSKEVKDKMSIIMADLKGFVSFFESDGWVLEE